MVDYELAIHNAIREVLVYSEIKAPVCFTMDDFVVRTSRRTGLSQK